MKAASNTFVERAFKTHKGKYDYSLVDYKGATTNVTIICPEHGQFEQWPSNHIQGKGCPLCTEFGIKLNKSGILYYVRFESRTHVYWKIGITNNTINERFSAKDLKNIKAIKVWQYARTLNAYKREQSILKKFSEFLYKGKEEPLSRGGNSELFTRDVLGLDKDYS